MKLKSARIENFKCFQASAQVEFDGRMTCVVGQNDSGKSSLLQALGPDFRKAPHRGVDLPFSDADSVVRFELEAEPIDIVEAARRGNPAWFPIGDDRDPAEAARAFNKQWSRSPLTVAGVVSSTSSTASLPLLYSNADATRCIEVSYADGRAHANAVVNNVGPTGSIAAILLNLFRERQRVCAAERPIQAAASFSESTALAPNASNLHSVLNRLQTSERAVFERLEKYIRRVFPHIEYVAPRSGNSEVSTAVSSVQVDLDRPDLLVSLVDSGTGVGHVLAILTYVVTSRVPLTILLDEPQSHLHPLAVRRLFDVLGDHPVQHQYIVATHSPGVVAAASPGCIIRVSRSSSGSSVLNVSPEAPRDLRAILDDVGALASDVFGADRVLWVEGESEERSVPRLIDHFLGKGAREGLQVVRFFTGDLHRSDGQKVLDIYRRLAGRSALHPPVVRFLFDGEHRQGIGEPLPDGVWFLPALMLENYLIDADAIAVVLSNLADFSEPLPTTAAVTCWLEEHLHDRKYWSGMPPANPALEQVHETLRGDRLLDDLFVQLSEGRYSFNARKPAHVAELVDAVLRVNPERLRAVAGVLELVLQSS